MPNNLTILAMAAYNPFLLYRERGPIFSNISFPIYVDSSLSFLLCHPVISPHLCSSITLPSKQNHNL
jgi:hypothetical protein